MHQISLFFSAQNLDWEAYSGHLGVKSAPSLAPFKTNSWQAHEQPPLYKTKFQKSSNISEKYSSVYMCEYAESCHKRSFCAS